MQLIRDWFERRFSDPQVLILVLLLVLGFAVVLALGKILAPFFAAIILAYLLEGIIVRLDRVGIRRIFSVILVFSAFLLIVFFLLVGVIPPLTKQVTQFVQQIPSFLSQFQALLETLPERYPNVITEDQVTSLVSRLNTEVAAMGQALLTRTFASVASVVNVLIFLVLVPVLVFFMLKDKVQLIGWLARYLPKDRRLATKVWHEVDMQIGNYVRGKVLEILIVGAVTFITFSLLELQYAILLSVMVGFSVLIPFVGAAVATIPVAIVAFFQFGWGGAFLWVIIAYGIIQVLDGNALVPLIFSEVVNLHPIAIIVAILMFGGLWGFWGVFFAIPLATLFNAVLRALPAVREKDVELSAQESEVLA